MSLLLVGFEALAKSLPAMCLDPMPDDVGTRNLRFACAAPAVHIAPPNGSMVLPSESVHVRIDVALPDVPANVLGAGMVLVHLIDGRKIKETNLSEALSNPVSDGAQVWKIRPGRTTTTISFRREFHPARFKGTRCNRDLVVTVEDVHIFSASGAHELRYELHGEDTTRRPIAFGSTQIFVRWSDRIGGFHTHPEGDLEAETRDRIKARGAMTLLARDLFTLEASRDRALKRDLVKLQHESIDRFANAHAPRVVFLISVSDGWSNYRDGHPLLQAGGLNHAGGISARKIAQHFESGDWLTGEPYLNEAYLNTVRQLNADVMFFETPGGPIKEHRGCRRFHRFQDPLIWPPFTYEHPQNQSCDPVFDFSTTQQAFVAQYDVVVSTNLIRLDGALGEKLRATGISFPASFDVDGDGLVDVTYTDATTMEADINLKLAKQARLYLPTYAFSTVSRHFDALKPRLDELGFCPVMVYQYKHQSEIPNAPWWWTYDVAAIRALRPFAKNTTICEFHHAITFTLCSGASRVCMCVVSGCRGAGSILARRRVPHGAFRGRDAAARLCSVIAVC